MNMTQQQLIDALEPLIDATDLEEVILALARTCNEKGEHLRCNWQDAATARAWDKAADALDRLTTTAAVRAVSR